MSKGKQKIVFHGVRLSANFRGLRVGAKTIRINTIFKNLFYSWTSSSQNALYLRKSSTSRRQNVCMIVVGCKHPTKTVEIVTSGFRYQGGARLVIYIYCIEHEIENFLYCWMSSRQIV